MPDGLTDQFITKLTIGYGAHAPRHGPVEDGPGRVIESQLALTVNGSKSNIAIVCCGPAINAHGRTSTSDQSVHCCASTEWILSLGSN